MLVEWWFDWRWCWGGWEGCKGKIGMCWRDVEVNEGGCERVWISVFKGECKVVGGGRGWVVSDRLVVD